MSKINVDTWEPESGTAMTLGASDSTITVPSGATLVGFPSGIEWQAVVTGTTLTAVAGKGYPINTTSNVCTVTLPASASVGDQIVFTDYARTWATYAVTLDQGSLKFQSGDTNPIYDTAGESVHIVYMDVTQGWVPLYDGAVVAEGTIYNFDYLVVAGGGGGGNPTSGPGHAAGGGGAGGYKTGTSSNLIAGNVITVVVGSGGAQGVDGENSSISGTSLTTVTSTGGGAGGSGASDSQGSDGGSGGGSGGVTSAYRSGSEGSGTGSEGNDGGVGYDTANTAGAGGGGAGAVGQDGDASNNGGDGGAGTANSITGSSVTYAGGGGGGSGYSGGDGTSAGAGGAGGGGAGRKDNGTATAGTANTGGGGGAGKGGQTSGAGGSGIVILKIADANYSGTTSGTVSVDTSSVADYTILSYTGDGTYTS